MNVTRLTADEIPETLRYALAADAHPLPAQDLQIQTFLDYVAQTGITCIGWRIGTRAHPLAVFVALLLPGDTAVVLPSAPSADAHAVAAHRAITDAALAALQTPTLRYYQALLDPHDAPRRTLLQSVGFWRLAPLSYLERSATFPWVDPPPADAATWCAYTPTRHAQFAAVVAATYTGSRDCPELNDLRTVEDALAAHRASGKSGTDLWELAEIDGDPSACLLLAEMTHGSALEVVYMGVTPPARGRGLGELLLKRALQQARTRRVKRLTLAVDERNTPACTLYDRLGFRPVGRRDAYVLARDRSR